ncbi:hypothetical protein J437_LFUL008566 [Ladona fulva]|uniref:SH3 domain-containing protein n=1 Tax=Ladona fulva TaxID=123851 RepID=A0A8K0K8U5_LADFU|nr:hypothetical protein J437_LFUL008566 [Ladona fulva]
MVSSSSFTFGEQDDWPIPAVRSTTSSPIGNIDLLSSLDVPSSDRYDTRSVSNPNIRNLSSTNGGNPARSAVQSEVPRTMNLAILGAMPTIIRAKPKPKERSKAEVSIASEEVVGSSPPMPSVPPPPPPPTVHLDDLNGPGDVEYPPDLPPRPWKQDEVGPEGSSSGLTTKSCDKPHGIALFDYPATHSDDLPFQTGDVILLIRKINDDWYYGQKEAGGNPGMFPSTFIRPVIDLPDDNDDLGGETDSEAAGMTWSQNTVGDRKVRALYSFKPEAAEDLDFEEGDVIEVTGQLDSEWLWGRLGDKWGQFPASFVDHVPRGLPQHCP